MRIGVLLVTWVLTVFSAVSASELPSAAAPAPLAGGATLPAGPVVAGEVGKRLDEHLTKSGYSGGALVAIRGEVVLMKGYGMADRQKSVPFRADTVYPIGSITKPMTAIAILKLEMQGKLKVEDPIARHLEGVPEDKRTITLHHLLTHTAGLDSDFAGDYDAVGRDEYVRLVLASKLRSKPGESYFYANSGYSLLGAIVERASGIGYEAYLRKEVFLPAGMTETGYKVSWPPARVAQGYGPNGAWGTILEKRWLDDGPGWALRANGGIHSTLADMYRLSLALDGNKILDDAAKSKMFKPQVPEGPGGGSFYGYGWAIMTTPWGGKLVEHNGGNRIFSADFRRYVDDGIVVVTASNDYEVKAFDASPALVRLARGGSLDIKALSDSPRHAILRGYFDAYNSGDVAKMRAFRGKHLKPSAKMTEEERDDVFRRMTGELGKLEVVGVAAETADTAEIVARSKNIEMPVRMNFKFEPGPDNLIGGIAVEIGGPGH